MDKNKLILYLQDIVKLETQKEIAYRTYNSLQAEYKEKLKNAAYRPMENQKRVTRNNTLSKVSDSFATAWFLFISIPLCAVAAAILKWPLIILIMFLDWHIFMTNDTNVYFYVIFFVLEAIVIVTGMKYLSEHSAERKKEQKEHDEMVVLAEKSADVLPVIKNSCEQIKKSYQQCDYVLQRLYNLGIIYNDPTYRTLEACTMFLQYLESGRTHSLQAEGFDKGAYNIFEEERRANIIIDKLDKISNQLDKVIKNQERLYREFCKINETVEEIYSSVLKIENYSHQTEINTRVSSWYNMVSAMNSTANRRMLENYYF